MDISNSAEPAHEVVAGPWYGQTCDTASPPKEQIVRSNKPAPLVCLGAAKSVSGVDFIDPSASMLRERHNPSGSTRGHKA